jgi:competence protein ComK
MPFAHVDYQCIVYEQDRILYVNKSPLELIETTCLLNFGTYVGSRIAVMFQTGFKRKVPISIFRDLFIFPTHSPSQFQCGWVFYHHVREIRPYSNPRNSTIQSVIIFKDGQQLELSTSYYVLEKQMQRTAVCILKFSGLQSDGPLTI